MRKKKVKRIVRRSPKQGQKKERYTMSFDPGVFEAFKDLCHENGRSASSSVQQLMAETLENHKGLASLSVFKKFWDRSVED